MFWSVLKAYLSFGRRAWILLPTLLAPPLVYALVALNFVPGTAGKPSFHNEYSDFFQTAAAVIASLLVVIAVESRLASKETRLATREAGVIAVVVIGAAEIAAIGALSPSLSPGLHTEVFSFTVSGGITGLLAVALVAARGAGWPER